MSDQSISSDDVRRLMEAAQVLNAVALRLAQAADSSGRRATSAAYDGASGLSANGDAGEVWCESEDAPMVAARATPRAVAAASGSAAALAQNILDDPSIGLATGHASGVRDQATARHNIQDTAAGRPAQRSDYDNAPGGTVELDVRMLTGVLALAQEYSFSVSEFVGGSHSPNSRHYDGVTADFNIINGRHVSGDHRDVSGFMARCRQLGATEVLGPGFPGHDNHVHAAWPRPA